MKEGATPLKFVTKTVRVVFAILFFGFLFFRCVARCSDISWTNTVGGNWSVAANWNPNTVPGSSDNACVTNDGSYTILLDVSVTVSNLTVGSASGIQNFSIGG